MSDEGLIEGATPPSNRGVDGSGRELARFPHSCPVGLPKLLRRLGVACQKRGPGATSGWPARSTFWAAPWVCDLAKALGNSVVFQRAATDPADDKGLFFAAVERAASDPEWLDALRSVMALAEPEEHRPRGPGGPTFGYPLPAVRAFVAALHPEHARADAPAVDR